MRDEKLCHNCFSENALYLNSKECRRREFLWHGTKASRMNDET